MTKPCYHHYDENDRLYCNLCREPFRQQWDELICPKCAEEYETVENALEIGAAEKENVELNGFLSFLFNENNVNEILLRYVRDNYDKKKLQDKLKEYFYSENGDWFINVFLIGRKEILK